MSPFLAIADSGTDSIRGQFVEHLLMLSTWACGRVGEPFPDHHLSLDPVPPGNLCSTQDPEIDAQQPRGRLQSFFLLAPQIWLHTKPLSDCTSLIPKYTIRQSLIPTNFSDPKRPSPSQIRRKERRAADPAVRQRAAQHQAHGAATKTGEVLASPEKERASYWNLFRRLQIYKQPNYQLKQPNFWLQPRQQLG